MSKCSLIPHALTVALWDVKGRANEPAVVELWSEELECACFLREGCYKGFAAFRQWVTTAAAIQAIQIEGDVSCCNML
jgi:hypothetical protein